MKARLIANPNALHGSTDLQDACRHLAEHGWSVELSETQSAGDATRLAREAGESGFDVVVACGGDGTINEVVNGLVGTGAILGVIPLGTSNMWATKVGLPKNPVDAAEALRTGCLHRVDVGQAEDRYFFVMAGVGLVTEMLKDPPSRIKEQLGGLVFLLNGLRKAFSFRGTRAIISLDGHRIRRWVRAIVIGNLPLDRGPVTITPDATVDDGLLDVAIFSSRLGVLEMHKQILRVLFRRPDVKAGYEVFQVRDMRIWTSQRLDVQTDGELHVQTPVRIRVLPKALTVLVPRPLADRPFSSDEAEPLPAGRPAG